jgi:tyrosinase
MSQSPVVILGAGLGGLTLARCLRQRGIPSIIYDAASPRPRHMYGITLNPSAYKPLLSVLGIDEETFRWRVAVDRHKQNGAGRVSDRDSPNATPIRASRSQFESLLREGQTIRFEHQLSSARIREEARKVELHFQNGLTLHPELLVDATGVHSALRKSILQDISVDVQPFAVYSGRRYLKPDSFLSLYAPAFGNGNVIVHEPGRSQQPRLEISVNGHQNDGTVSISYIYSRAAKNSDPLHRPERTNASATDIPPDFYDELTETIRAIEPGKPFDNCFDTDQIRSERLLHWLMRTVMVPKQDLLKLLDHGVLTIGDAVHAVPILGGHGANIAILDAIGLAEVLANGQDAAVLKEFYDQNWSKWQAAVAESQENLVAMHAGSEIPTSIAGLNENDGITRSRF